MQVTVSDGEIEAVGKLILEITDENEAPVFGRDSYYVYGNEGKVWHHFNATTYLMLLYLRNLAIVYLKQIYIRFYLNMFFSNNLYIISKKQYCSLLNNNISLESHVFIVGGRTIWTG